MKAIIVDGGQVMQFGDHVYYLIAEDGEGLCSHICSSPVYAPGDLYAQRPERLPMFEAKGITEFCWLEDSGISREELLERNRSFAPAGEPA